MEIVIKRVYEPAATGDGYRVLVDRLWPRGVAKASLVLDEWCKDIAPSPDLRTWFAHDPAKFDEFTFRYMDELKHSDAPQALLKRTGKNTRLTLVYAAKDPNINHARVLKDYLAKL